MAPWSSVQALVLHMIMMPSFATAALADMQLACSFATHTCWLYSP